MGLNKLGLPLASVLVALSRGLVQLTNSSLLTYYIDPVDKAYFKGSYYYMKILSKPNVTQLNSTQSNCKSNFVGLDIVLTWNPPHHAQTFQSLLDQLES